MSDNNVQHAFTTSSQTIVKKLINTVHINSNGKTIDAKALWDTGATGSCISHEVASKLNLISGGKKVISTPSGTSTVNTYLVNLTIDPDVNITDLQVNDSAIGSQGIDMLIGMDIITLGDFCVSNFNGRTTFTFRTPSSGYTDYTRDIKKQNAMIKKPGNGAMKKKKR